MRQCVNLLVDLFEALLLVCLHAQRVKLVSSVRELWRTIVITLRKQP